RALLRTTLSRYADVAPRDWRFELGPYGRPSLARGRHASVTLSFNVSHTTGLLAIAVSRTTIGVDIETVERPVEVNLASRFFAPAESAALDALHPSSRPRRFLELWTLKESYAKARGLGLRLPFDGFAFDLDVANRIAFKPERGADRHHAAWSFLLLEPGSRHLCALCCRSDGAPPALACRSMDGPSSEAAGFKLLRTSGTAAH
ncbi:MAG: 4'-phosphopantetheinyl transferase superfamily protein, partial [Burkholderiaceae bacterium]